MISRRNRASKGDLLGRGQRDKRRHVSFCLCLHNRQMMTGGRQTETNPFRGCLFVSTSDALSLACSAKDSPAFRHVVRRMDVGPSPASGLRGARSPGLCPVTRNIEIPKFGFPLVIRFTHDRRT